MRKLYIFNALETKHVQCFLKIFTIGKVMCKPILLIGQCYVVALFDFNAIYIFTIYLAQGRAIFDNIILGVVG